MISITILNRLTVRVSMEVRFIPTAKRFSSLTLHDSLLPLRGSIKEKERKKNIVGSLNYVPHNLLLEKNEIICFVNLTGIHRCVRGVHCGRASLSASFTKYRCRP